MGRTDKQTTASPCNHGICILSVVVILRRSILRCGRYHRCFRGRSGSIQDTENTVAGIQIRHDFLYASFTAVFASIGIKVVLPAMNGKVVGFTVVLVIVAVLTKVLGCGLGAKVCGYKNYQCARIGVGMISRGEVALIVADKGSALGLMGSSFLGPVVIVVVITTIITPILLKFVFRFGPKGASGTGALASNYEQIEKYREGEMDK